MENKSNILVIGGTGKTGRKIVKQLIAKGQKPHVGSRSATPPFDWNQPEEWHFALKGMDMVYISFHPDLAVPGALEAIEELVKQAKDSGIKKIVLLSGKGEREAELCEQVVIHSGLDYTIVRASWFNQNFSESFFLDPIQEGLVALPQAEAKVPYVDTDDISEVVVKALLEDDHNGKIYQLTGPRVLTFREVIHEISVATGRTITFVPITLSAYTKALKEQGVPSDFVWLISYLFTEVLENPKNAELTHDIEQLLGRKPKDFKAYAKEMAASGIWDEKVIV